MAAQPGQQPPPPAGPDGAGDAGKERLNQLLRMLRAAFEFVARRVQQHAGISRAAAVVVTAGAAAACMGGFSNRGLLSSVAGYVWPVYASFKAIRTPEKDDDTQWLTYWVVFGTLEAAATVLPLRFIPMYSVAKCVFLLWCYLPQTRGANLVFRVAIEPFLTRYENSIDAGVARFAGHANAAAAYAADAAEAAGAQRPQ